MSEKTSKGTSGQSVPKSKFRHKSRQEQAAESKLRMEKRGEKLDKARGKLAKQKPPKRPGPVWKNPPDLAAVFSPFCCHLLGGLPVVAGFTQRLMVCRVDEQGPVPTKRRDVVHHRSFGEFPLSLTLHTQWMATKELLTSLLPSATVPTLAGAFPIPTMQGLVHAAIRTGTISHQLRASWVFAWDAWSVWHVHTSHVRVRRKD